MVDISKSPLVEAARTIAVKVAGPAAADVDQNARFPREALEAMRKERLLSCYVPKSFGGAGATVAELAAMSEELGKHCAATAMVFAMHQIQVACVVHHAMKVGYFQNYLKEIVEKQNLIGSVTSEAGVGGEMRSSICAVERNGQRFKLNKDSTTSSYGEQADDLLVTARRSADAPASDQVLVLVRKADFTFEKKGNWDPMGMRGTCSYPFKLTSSGGVAQIFEVPFAEISSQTMVPFSHLVWAGAWIGLAKAAVNKTRAYVRGLARAKPGTVPPQAVRLAELVPKLQLLRTSTQCILDEYERLIASPEKATEHFSSIGYALKLNNLKLSGSEIIVEIVDQALKICGVMGYKNDSKFSMGRHLRDAHAAALMVGNDRILHTNAGLLLILKDD